MLSDMLGDSFGPDNWTSEARGVVGGFSPFEGDSLGDFTYHDFDGTLTRIWCHSEAWVESGRPTYHIEVKSTAGTAQEPFQMSRHQLDIVSLVFSLRYDCFAQSFKFFRRLTLQRARVPVRCRPMCTFSSVCGAYAARHRCLMLYMWILSKEFGTEG